MVWALLSFISALFTSFTAVIERKALFKEHAMEFSVVLALFNFILSMPLIFLAEFNISLSSYFFIFFTALFGTFGFLFYAKSIRHMEVSSFSPLLAFGPIVSFIIAFIFLGEVLTFMQISGILLIVLGAYYLQIESNNLINPLKKFIRSKYTYYILIGMFSYSFSSLFGRIVLNKASPYSVDIFTYFFLVHFFIAVNFLILLVVFHDGFKGIKKGLSKNSHWILLTAVCFFISRFALSAAFSIPEAMLGLVLAIKRSSMLLSTVMGGAIFKERNLKKKIFATLIMLIGLYLIIL